jgi:hypothetical protein
MFDVVASARGKDSNVRYRCRSPKYDGRALKFTCWMLGMVAGAIPVRRSSCLLEPECGDPQLPFFFPSIVSIIEHYLRWWISSLWRSVNMTTIRIRRQIAYIPRMQLKGRRLSSLSPPRKLTWSGNHFAIKLTWCTDLLTPRRSSEILCVQQDALTPKSHPPSRN